MGLFDNPAMRRPGFGGNMTNLGLQLLAAGQGGGMRAVSSGPHPNQLGQAAQAMQGFTNNNQQSQLFAMQQKQYEMALAKQEQEQQRRKANVENISKMFSPGGPVNQYGDTSAPPAEAGMLANHPQAQALRTFAEDNPGAFSALMAKQALAKPPQKTGLPYEVDQARLGGFTGTQLDYVKAKADAGRTPGGTSTEMDKTRASLQRMGMSEEQIDLFMTNKDRFSMQVTPDGVPVVFDKYTNKVDMRFKPPSEATAPIPSATQPSATPTTAPSEAPGSLGSGVSGAWSNVMNSLTDMVGLGLAAPESQDAYESINQLHNQIMLTGTAAVEGRASNQMREILEEQAPKPGNIFFGDGKNLNRLKNTQQIMNGEITRMQGLLQNPGGLTAKQRSELRANVSQLLDLSGQISRMREGWNAKRTPGTTLPAPGQTEQFNGISVRRVR